MLNHRRSPSSSSSHPPTHSNDDPNLPSQTYHPSHAIPLPTTALVESAAGGAHYSGALTQSHRRSSHGAGTSPERPSYSNHHHSSSSSAHPTMDHLHGQNLGVTQHEAHPDHARIMVDLAELYGCRPNAEIFERSWRKDAIFEDPLVKAKGYSEYAAQFFALPKLFSKSETIATRVMSSSHAPNKLVYSQQQRYTYKMFGGQKTINSIVTVDLDEDSKIIHIVDQWDGKDLPVKLGAGVMRRMNGRITPWLVRTPKPSSGARNKNAS